MQDQDSNESPSDNRKRQANDEASYDQEGSKRLKTTEAAEEDKTAGNAQEDETKQEVSYTLKDGKLRADGKIQGAKLHVQGNKSFTVEQGEAILLLKLANPEATEPTPHPALVVGFYSKDGGKMFTIRVRWLITAQELGALPTDFPWTGLDRVKVLAEMGNNEVVLSPQIDDLPVQSIVEKASVKLHWIYDDDNSPKHNRLLAVDVPEGTLTCQYQLKLDADHSLHLDYARLGTANNLEGTGSQVHVSSAHGSHSSLDSHSFAGARGAESSDDDADEATDEDEKRVVAEGEGSNLRTSIAVGPAFQAAVPPYQPNAVHTVSRRPAKPVWKPGKISEDTLADFLEKAAAILNDYLRKNLLTATEPYTPIPNERAEDVMRENPGEGPLTGSSLSTASVLSTVRRNALLKECDVDRLMERLWDCNGNVTEALSLVDQEPTRFISACWPQFEKDMFNDHFRLHHGAIRKVAKAVAPFKTMQEVIDYQYRFKIPDQFRLYQERKREIAVRIVECIDHRRVIDPSTEPRRRPLGSSGQHWSETNANDLVRATEERREKAKQLMLDVNEILGKSVTGQIANAVKELNRSDTPAARAALFSLLHGHTDLQRRFNEFLPKQV